MASFIGHIDEGAVFIIIALWWVYKMATTYAKCQAEQKSYETQLSYTATIRGRQIPLEIGFIAECFANQLLFLDDNGNFLNHNGMQHMTIYFTFVFHGITDLVDHLRLTSFRDLKYITFGLAFIVYGTGFYFHSDPSTGKPPLELIVHRIALPLMFLMPLVILTEIFKRDSVVIHIIRCHILLTFGTWFSYISFILYDASAPISGNPNLAWDPNNTSNVHFMGIAFAMHMIFNMVLILSSFYLAESYWKCPNCIPRMMNRTEVKYEQIRLLDDENTEIRDNEC